MLHIKLWRIIKALSVLRAFNIICILFYCGLYTMAIDVVTWRIIKKWCIWSLDFCNFLWLPVFALFLQKLCRLSRNYSNFMCIYLKLKLITEKHIHLKWVFLPQWIVWQEMIFILQLLVLNWLASKLNIESHHHCHYGRNTHFRQICFAVPNFNFIYIYKI